tara:strand:+ start:32 stop:502 length:471 start_codon:yes stop_codon:yes gene_type:complete
MRKDDFVMRGQTVSYNPSTGKGGVEVLNFSGRKPGYAYRLVQFDIYPSTQIGSINYEMCASITAGKSRSDPVNPNFNDDALIANVIAAEDSGSPTTGYRLEVINDTFLITQNLILSVEDTQTAQAINWQCRFRPVKLAKAEEAVANYKQFQISDGS